MKRIIAILINIIILFSLIIYCVHYVLGDCTECFNAKINDFFVLLVAMILTSLFGLCLLLFNTAKKKKR